MTNPRRSRRRLALAIVVVFAVVGIFAVRLVDIQLVRADQLTADSLGKRAVKTPTYAARGAIVDTNGVVLADSVNRFDLTVSPANIALIDAAGFLRRAKDGTTSRVTVMQAATEIANLTKQDPATIFSSLTKNPTSNYALVSKSVDLATKRAIEKLKIPGTIFKLHPRRTYPNGAVAGNLTGYMSTDGPGGGLELGDDKSCLRSTSGSTTYEQGADGVQIPGSEVINTASKPGGTLKLSIDSDLQWFALQAIAEQGTAIGAQSATAIVLRIKDFHLMAVADWPPVDPNNVDGSDLANYGSHAFTAQYEPGSVFKAMSASMLIDTGIGSPAMQAVVPSHWVTPEGSTVNDAAPHPEQHLTLTGVLQNSSNVGISKLGSQVPEKTRLDYMKKFGLGQATAVGFPGEATGLINKLPWDNQTHYNVLYGQGVSATALQVAQIFATLGNGGMRLPTTLVESCTKADGTVTGVPSATGTRVVSVSTAKTVVNMLESVVQAGELSKAVKIPGYRVAGKSGTAEVASNGRYTGDRVVSFAGIAPAEDPQYVVVVTYTKPATIKSSAAAAPTFKKIMSQVLTKYRVPPSTSPSTYPATTW